MPTSNDPNILLSLTLKILAGFGAFISGMVATVWAVSGKINGFSSRLEAIEVVQHKCQRETLGEIKTSLDKINDKIDAIPDVIDGKLSRAHHRIDSLYERTGHEE